MTTSKIVYEQALRTTCTHIHSNDSYNTDAPLDNNGKGEAFSPTDTVATGLGSCMLTMMGIHARSENYDIDGTSVDITKHMSSDSPRRIVKIDVNMTVNATKSLTEKDKTILEKIALNCPVAKSLHPDITQDVQIKFN